MIWNNDDGKNMMIADLQRENNTLKDENGRLESEVYILQEQKNNLEQEVYGLQVTIRRMRAEYSELYEMTRYLREPQPAIAEIILDVMSSGRLVLHLERMGISEEEFLRQLYDSGLTDVSEALAEQAKKADKFTRNLKNKNGVPKQNGEQDDECNTE